MGSERMVGMALKRLIQAFLALSAIAIASLFAYHYYVEEETSTLSIWHAFEEYNEGTTRIATTAISAVLGVVRRQQPEQAF